MDREVKMKNWIKKESSIKQLYKVVPATLRLALPLSLRMRIVHWARRWRLPGNFILSMDLLRDFAESKPNEFHRFVRSGSRKKAGST